MGLFLRQELLVLLARAMLHPFFGIERFRENDPLSSPDPVYICNEWIMLPDPINQTFIREAIDFESQCK